jgi:hypothetical protein
MIYCFMMKNTNPPAADGADKPADDKKESKSTNY